MAKEKFRFNKYSLDNEYFKYRLGQIGLTIKDLSEEMKIPYYRLNRVIRESTIDIIDIFAILDHLDLKFEDIFKFKENVV